VEAAVLTRDVQRAEILKSSDVIVQRRPKAEVGGDAAARNLAVGMQMRRPVRAGQALRTADLAKPDLVQRDDNVTLIYQTAGIYLTIRGKAVEAGTEGDTVSVLNLQSKRTVSGVVIGRDQVAISVATPRPLTAFDTPASSDVGSTQTGNVSVAAGNSSPTAPKAE
jgi:flagella basal body P-ring formation protein FlgA